VVKKNYFKSIFPLMLTLFLSLSSTLYSFEVNPDISNFLKEMEDKHDFKKEDLIKLVESAKFQEKVIRIMDRQPEGTMTWGQYKKIMVNSSRIDAGKEFINIYRNDLKRAEDIYGVPAQVIAAILGVESRYGKGQGTSRVLDSLMTLSFYYPRREKFFKIQLENFLLLTREEDIDPYSVMGSIAGAMGYGQFMPDSYRDYAVDFDFDGKRDLFNNASDAIGSVANFLSKKGKWKPNSGIVVPALLKNERPKIKSSFKPNLSLDDLEKQGLYPLIPLMQNQKFIPIELESEVGFEYWIGMHNYNALSRYNRSKLYIMAVVELSNSLINSF
tara:strand:+ start:18608 stop:19594 length:987 start_codon:yes stop_codon:yes gene_type:complete